MSSIDVRPRPRWADVARMTFWTSWALVPIITVLDSTGVIDAGSGPWYALRILVSVVWTLAGLTWAAGEYRRRH